jgi:hypothetical protein
MRRYEQVEQEINSPLSLRSTYLEHKGLIETGKVSYYENTICNYGGCWRTPRL